LRLNERVYTVGGLPTQNGLQWRSVSDQQKIDERERHGCSDVISHDYQQQQQQQQVHHELAETNKHVTKSLQMSATSAAAAVSGDASSMCSGLRSSVLAVSSTSQAANAATAVTHQTSWSGGQSTAAWVCPSNVQLARGPCEAASLAQQMMSGRQISTQEHSCDDKLMFEDGLIHLRNLYESQLASYR